MGKLNKYIMFFSYPSDRSIAETFELNTKYQVSYETPNNYVYINKDNKEILVNKDYQDKYYMLGNIYTSNAYYDKNK